MKTLKISTGSSLLVIVLLLAMAKPCLAQSDEKGRVNLPARVAAPATLVDDDAKGRVELKMRIPNVVGKKYAEAKKTLESAGFTVHATGQVFSRVDTRTVTSQAPSAGTAAARGATVTCNIQ